MSFNTEKLYELLPAFYRLRDIELGTTIVTPSTRSKLLQLQQDLDAVADPESDQALRLRDSIDRLNRGPLKALLSVIAEQMAVLEENLDQLYDDQFIETCAEWVVPYIGDLVGARGLHPIDDAPFSQRAEVANTIGYRRRKGTASVIQQLAQDATGWNASVVEFFLLLATTQYMKHLRPGNLSFADLRNEEALTWSNTPFDTLAHTADVRRIARKRGKYNIPNIGIFLWRIRHFSSTQAPAFKVDDTLSCYRYRFNPLGKDSPLYQKAEKEQEVTKLAGPADVPMPLRRSVLKKDLASYYGPVGSLEIYRDGVAVPVEEISICDLSDLKDSWGNITGWNHLPLVTNKVSVDPVLGRLAFPSILPAPGQVDVSYYYGFSAEMGGGEYERTASFTVGLKTLIQVPKDAATIQDALDALPAEGGVVEIQNNDYYVETPVIQAAEGATIELRAADQCRPVLVLGGPMVITGGANAKVSLNGLLVSGGYLHLPALEPGGGSNQLYSLTLQHCTLAPGDSPAIGGVAAQPAMTRIIAESPDTTLFIDQCIIGGLRAADNTIVQIGNSIVDAGLETATAYSGLTDDSPAAPLTVSNSTIIGKVYTRILNASNTIFMGGLEGEDPWPSPLMAERLQEGCTRFCYLPPGARVPRPYHCQPEKAADAGKVKPVFTSRQYGDAGYCQLSTACPCAITQGADDGSEIGCFHQLYQPQRLANLRTRLDEYLRFGLEAGIFLAS